MNVDRVLNRVRVMAQQFGNFETEYIVKLFLLDLGLPSHMEGFQLLTCGVTFRYENPEASMTKQIYPAIANACGGQSTHVEIAIRRAIQVAWKDRGEKWMDYFPGRRKPTNSQVISTLVELLIFWKLCRKNLDLPDTE